MKRLLAFLAVGFALTAIVAPAQAAPLVNISNTTGAGLGNPPFTLGYEFTVGTEPLLLSALGLFDDSQNGLAESHNLGLWNSSGTLLASATLGSGTSGTLIDQFRYVSIAPVLLDAGQTYRIGGLYTTGDDALIFPGDATGFSTDPHITFGGSRFAFGGTLSDPTASAGGDPSYFGPNALIGPVPEPATLVVFGTLAVGAFGLRRRAKAPAA